MSRFVTLISVLILYACIPQERKGNTLSLEFEMEQLKVESEGGCSDTTVCASFEVNYPRFLHLDSIVQSTLMNSINKALGYDNPDSEKMSIEEKGNRFVNDYENFVDEFGDNAIGWYFLSNCEPMLVSDTLISISVNSEFFTGGAHGGFTTYFVNIDPVTGKTVTLESIFKDGYEEALRKAGENSFRDARVIPDSDSFDESGFEFPDNQFKLNNNYGFRKEGIVFFYNNYEIAPYSLGPTEILIPFEVMRQWLR